MTPDQPKISIELNIIEYYIPQKIYENFNIFFHGEYANFFHGNYPHFFKYGQIVAIVQQEKHLLSYLLKFIIRNSLENNSQDLFTISKQKN